MREIVLDTETTGLDPSKGDRIVEIGCVELHNGIATGRTYHQFINPERAMSQTAFEITGISDDMLRDKPLFKDIAEDFLRFIGHDPLVIHNAQFDMKFLNWELGLVRRPELPLSQAIDTLEIARRKFPGSPASLDALCRRFKIDSSARVKHGALLDCELLAEVYLELMGGRQLGFDLDAEVGVQTNVQAGVTGENFSASDYQNRSLNVSEVSAAEKSDHAQFLESLQDPLWLRLSEV